MDMTPVEQKDDDRRITYFAATHTRGKREMFGIRAGDRGKHVYVIGKTGMGKSTLLENMAIQDIQNGEGICFIDPHGSTAEKLLDFIPYERINDVIYFAPFDTDHPVGFNVMEDVGFDKRHLVVSGLMGALKRIWVDAWSARMEYILQNTLLALLEYPGSTLLDVNKMLTNKTFRAAVVEKITDPIVRAFWTEEFAAFTDSYTREATPAIQNKVGQFTANPLIRNIVGQSVSSFDLRQAMDNKKIFIVNLSKGRMGESNAALLGSMLTVKIYLAAMSRADEPASVMARLPRCYFYVDEFQSMMNEAFADILSESRKYKLALTLANQYIEQMEEEVRDAVFGNVGTLICFRVGPFDAEVLETVFKPTFVPEDLIGLGIGQIYLTLMIDGVGSPPFSAETIPPIEPPRISYREDVINRSRALYGRPRATVEEAINQKQLDFAPPAKRAQGPQGGSSGSAQGQHRDYRPNPQTARAFNRSPDGAPVHQDPAPRPPMRAYAPVAATPQALPASVPFPNSQHIVVEREVPAKHGADTRGALRAAIEAARSSHDVPNPARVISHDANVRAPADILRAKQAARPPAKEHHQTNHSRAREGRQPFTVSPKASNNGAHEERNSPPPVRAESAQAGEVSREVLERVLNGGDRD